MSEVKTNKITSLASNNDITLDPDGTGDVVVASGHNLGIGTTSPARQLTVSNSGAALLLLESTGDDNGQLLFGDSADGTIGKVGYAHSTNHLFFNTNGSEQMRITSDGDVGVGTSSPTLDSALAGLSVSSNSTLLQIHDSDGACVKLSDPASGANRGLGIALQGTSAVISNCESGELRFGTGNTERMRIDSSGRLFMGVTSNTTGGESFTVDAADGFRLFCSRGSTSAREQIIFFNPNGDVGSIDTSGTSTSYNTSSDHRLKENVADMTGAIDRVKALAPKRFNFIADADTTVDGFLAHEAQTVVPEAVTGTHNEVDDDGNAVMQGIDQAKLVPLLTGALKEAIAKIEALEARVTALEDA